MRSSWVGPRPPETRQTSAPSADRRADFEVDRVVSDDHDALGHEPERECLAGIERPVAVGALAAHELAPRDDDDRARAVGHPLTAVAPDTVSRPLGWSTYREPFNFTTTFRGRSTDSDRDFLVNRWVWPFSSVPV